MNYSKKTTKGKRINNEDFVFASNKKLNLLNNLFIVCDGVGGNSYGEVASRTAVRSFIKAMKIYDRPFENNDRNIKSLFQYGIDYADKCIRNIGNIHIKKKGMCTTFICSTIANNKLYASSIGDSRLYVISKNNNANDDDSFIDQITIDDVAFVEQKIFSKEVIDDMTYVVDKNTIDNISTIRDKYLTKTLGHTLNVHGNFYEVDLNDKLENNYDVYILLCTDGLYNMLSNDYIKNIVLDEKLKLKDKTKKLVKNALDAGGHDNISAILINV